jgi:hypothetical protein
LLRRRALLGAPAALIATTGRRSTRGTRQAALADRSHGFPAQTTGYMPMPAGTPAPGLVPISNGDSLGDSTWGTVTANVQYMDALGADATGANDCTSLFNAALSGLPTLTVAGVTYPHGIIQFGCGVYLLGVSETDTVGPFVHVRGMGNYATVLNYTGSGRCLRLQNPAANGSVANTIMAGGVVDLTIDGSNAGAGAIGLMYGDMNGGKVDVAIQYFNKAGSVGLQFVNAAWDTEKNRVYARLVENTVNVQFTVIDGPSVQGVSLVSTTSTTATFSVASGGFPGFYPGGDMWLYGSAGLTTPVSGNASAMSIQSVSGNTLVCSYTGTTPSGNSGTLTMCSARQSFDYNEMMFSIITNGGIASGGKQAGQTGVQFLNGANPAGGSLTVVGNFAQSNTVPWSGAAPAIVHLDGRMPQWHPTQGATYFSDVFVRIQAEGDPAQAKYAVYPIRFSGAAAASVATSHGWTGCSGLMYFSGTADASLGQASVSFSGPVQGVPSLNRTNLPGNNSGRGSGAQSYFDAGRPIDTAGRPYQQITGLMGANIPFTLVGAVQGAAPTTGKFAVNDVALDLANGGYWVCTAAGSPGAWTHLP